MFESDIENHHNLLHCDDFFQYKFTVDFAFALLIFDGSHNPFFLLICRKEWLLLTQCRFLFENTFVREDIEISLQKHNLAKKRSSPFDDACSDIKYFLFK